MKLWIMCADSESGDHYHSCAWWDHNPTKEEIDEIKVHFDGVPLEPEDESDDETIVLNGVRYVTFITHHEISEIEIGE